jgi:hypothetical protein
MTANLDRRLTALEEIAVRVRRREMRDLILALPDVRDLTPTELEAATDEAIRCQDRIAAWRQEGLSLRQILQREADELGIGIDVFEAECRAIGLELS